MSDSANSIQADFFSAVAGGDEAAVATLLQADPALVRARDASGHSPIMAAAYRGQAGVLALLRAYVPEPTLHEAVVLGDVERLRVLLTEEPSATNALSPDGWTALHLAGFFGQAEAARVLLEAGAEVDVWSENAMRNTPLHAAIAGAREKAVIEPLVAAGADVNAAGAGGYTPLHLAASRGDLPLIELLLAHGAEARMAEGGETPVSLATERGHPDAARRLEKVPLVAG